MNNNLRGFKLSMVFFSLLVFLISTVGALGVVWLRQQISRTADNCITKEKELAVLQRRNTYLQSAIAQVHNPEYLKEQAGSKLSVPSKKQVVWVNPTIAKDQSRYVAAKLKENQVMAMALNNSQRIVR